MNVKTWKSEKIVSVRQMARQLYPDGLPSDTAGGLLYIFREGFNVSGKRFIAFVKDVRIKSSEVTKVRTSGFFMTPKGKEIRYLYEEPSHHYWLDDERIMDNVKLVLPFGGEAVRAYYIFKGDGLGKPKEMLWIAPNGHNIYHPCGEWILPDTYSTNDPGETYDLNGHEFLYMHHIPTKKMLQSGNFNS